MDIKIGLNENDEIEFTIGSHKVGPLELMGFFMVSKKEDIREQLGSERPGVVIEGAEDARLSKAKRQLNDLLDRIYAS